jgi:hypothetical protein
MKRRVALAVGAAVVVIGGACWFLRPGSRAAQATARRSAKIDVRDVNPAAPAAVRPDKPKPRMVMTESGWKVQTTRTKPREWVDPVSGAVRREILDGVPDPEAAAAEELKYRKSRLRLTLADNAAPCWSGGESKEEIEIEYTLVVENEVIRADNVRTKTSNITDPAVERCIIDSVRDLRTLGDKIPDMREDQGVYMSLHDLHDRNEREVKNKAAEDKP